MNLLRGLCALFGYELIARKKSPNLPSHLRNLFRHHQIDVVLDVGANHGQFASLIREIGYQGDIYSFEPVRETYRKLSERAAQDPRWHVFNTGLGDTPCQQTIHLSKSSDLCSILAPNNCGKAFFPAIEAQESESITIDTVDEFLVREKIPDQARIFLKMDTQGYDMMVFAGAKNSFNRIVAMLTELSFIPIYEGSTSYIESLATFEKSGFHVSGIYPVSKKPDMTVIEMDCVLINQKKS